MERPTILLFVLSMLLNFESFYGAPTHGEVCVQQPRDLFLVVDDSASIGHTDIKKVREFLSELVASVHVSHDMTRVGFLQFSDEKNTGIRFNLDNNFDAETIRQKFLKMKYNGGAKTLTGLALQLVAEQVFTKTGGDRPNVPDVVVVLTDGQSRNPSKTIEQANRLKDMGVRIVAIGAGAHLTRNNVLNTKKEKLKQELLAIASSPEDMKMVNIQELEKIVVEIVDKVCRIVTTAKPPTPATQSQRLRFPAPRIPVGHSTSLLGVTPTSAPDVCAASPGRDILFVIDGTVNFQQSYDESEKDFRRIKKLIKVVVRALADERFYVGVMQYTKKGEAKMVIDFMSLKDQKELKIRVGAIIQEGGYKRFTGDALVKANDKFYNLDAFKQRESNPNVIILITRGTPHDQDHAISEARMLESRNVRLVTVGVHSSAKKPKHLANFLREITYPKFMFLFQYRNLRKNSQALLDAVCEKEDPLPLAGLPLESAQCRRGPHDIFFVIDGSASIKNHNFEKVQIFLMDFISLLRVDSSQINTGLMQFSRKDLTTVVWELGAYTEFETIKKLRNMKYQAGTMTNTGDALTRVNNQVFSGGPGDRPGIDDIVILFTDGNAHDIQVAREQANILKSKGVLVMTIGAGKKSEVRLFQKELVDMASSPEYAMTVDFDQLQYFAETAFPLVCKYMRLKKL